MSSIQGAIELIERVGKAVSANDGIFVEALKTLVSISPSTALFSAISQTVLISEQLSYTDKVSFFKTLTEVKMRRGFGVAGILDALAALHHRPSLKMAYFTGIALATQRSDERFLHHLYDILICEIEDTLLFEQSPINDDTLLQTLITILPLIPPSKLRLMDVEPLKSLLVNTLYESLRVDNLDGSLESICERLQQRPHYSSIASISHTLSRLCTLWTHQAEDKVEGMLSVLLDVACQNERMWMASAGAEIVLGEDTPTSRHYSTLLFATLTILHNVLTHGGAAHGFVGVLSGDYCSMAHGALQILSNLAVINGALYPDEELRQWRSTNMLCVDMLNATRSAEDSERVLGMLTSRADSAHPATVNHLFLIAEHTILNCSKEFAVADVLPVCERYIEDSSDLRIFENAHSVMLTFFAGVEPSALDDVLVARVMSYSITLLKNIRVLSQEQFATAYQSVVKKVSAHSAELTRWCVDGLLDAFMGVEEDLKVKVAHTIPTLLPYIEAQQLGSFLLSLERMLDSPWIVDIRDDLLTLTLKSIKRVEDENSLLICLDWWSDYNARLEKLAVRARL